MSRYNTLDTKASLVYKTITTFLFGSGRFKCAFRQLIAAITNRSCGMENTLCVESVKEWVSANCQPLYWTGNQDLNPQNGITCINANLASESDHWSSRDTSQKITEYQTLRELLWSFQQSEPSPVLFAVNKGKTVPKSGITIPSLDSKSFQALMVQFAETLDALNGLVAFCTQIRKSPVNSTYQGYASALNERIIDFKNFVVTIETRFCELDETFTLLTLRDLLADELTCLKSLYWTYTRAFQPVSEQLSSCFKAVRLLNVLLEETDKAQLTESYFRDHLLLFVASLRPYLTIINNWFQSGRLIDPFNEFFLHAQAPTKSVDQSRTWSETVVFRDTDIQQEVLRSRLWQTSLDNLLVAGISTEILSHIKQATTNFDSKSNLFNEFLENLMAESPHAGFDTVDTVDHVSASIDLTELACVLLLNKALQTGTDVEKKPTWSYKSNLPLSVMAERALSQQISRYYNCVCPALGQVVREKCGLREHLMALRSVLFMEAGDVLNDVCSELFFKIDNDEEWKDERYLTLLLYNCTQAKIRGAKNFSISLTNITEAYFANITVNYEVPWPASVVITPESLQTYNEIFRFSLVLVRSLKALQRLRFTDLEEASKHCLDNPGESLPTLLRMRRLHLLRSWLLHFLGSVHGYIISSLHVNALLAEKAILEASDLGKASAEHQLYLQKAREYCLLRAPPQLLRTIFEVSDIALTVAQVWNHGIQSLTTALLCQLETNYVGCHRFVVPLLTTMAEQQQITYLERLTATLMHSCPDTDT